MTVDLFTAMDMTQTGVNENRIFTGHNFALTPSPQMWRMCAMNPKGRATIKEIIALGPIQEEAVPNTILLKRRQFHPEVK
jgi:hypothetical protein